MPTMQKKGKAKKEEEEKKAEDVNPRLWTPAQRRELWLKNQASSAKKNEADWKVLRSDLQDITVPYGFITLDSILRLRQVPRRGRVVQIHGDEGAGKSTLGYGIIANHIRQTGEPAAIHDFENTSEWPYLRGIGIDQNLCEVYTPTSIDESCARVMDQLKSGVRTYMFDSVRRMKTQIEEKDIVSGKFFKDLQPGQHAKMMNKFWDSMLPYFAQYDCLIVMINQTAARIDSSNEGKSAQKYPTFTNLPYVLPGGKLTRFVMSVMIELKRQKAYRSGEMYKNGDKEDPFILEPNPQGGKEKGDYIATQVRARVIKNKVNDGGFREGPLFTRPGIGVDENMTMRYIARQYGLIANAGAKFYVGDSESPIITYPSKEKAIQDLVIDQNPDVYKALRPVIEKAVAEDQASFMTQIDDQERAYLEGEIDMDEIEANPIVKVKGFVVDDI